MKILKSILFFIIAILIISCSKDESDISNLYETIIVRHKNADMPAYIRGNGSEKVFLIILHGGPGGHGLQYRINTFITDIEKNNAVVYFDQRGSGNAQGSFSKSEINVDIMAEDVLALAKVIKNKYGDDSKLFLMGHSWGGTLGPATLLKDQTFFNGWIDVDGAHDPKGMIYRYIDILPDVAEEQINLGNSVEHWNDIISRVESVDNDHSTDNFFKLNNAAHKSEDILTKDNIINESIAELDDNLVLNNPIKIIWNGIGISDKLSDKGLWSSVSYTDQLKEITIPSLVLWGRYDLIVPTTYAQEAYDKLGSTDKNLFIFEKSGHSPMSTEPKLFADRVIDFINRH